MSTGRQETMQWGWGGAGWLGDREDRRKQTEIMTNCEDMAGRACCWTGVGCGSDKSKISPENLTSVSLPRWGIVCVWSLGQEVPLEEGMVTHFSTLRTPRDREAWQATVHRVTKSWTWPKWLSMSVCVHVHASAQGRILEWAVLSVSRGPSQPRDQTHVSVSPALAGGFFINVPPGKNRKYLLLWTKKVSDAYWMYKWISSTRGKAVGI